MYEPLSGRLIVARVNDPRGDATWQDVARRHQAAKSRTAAG
ncbi:hypothetical protein [Streptomyces sp. NRRL S-1022]|nr:hypothetical protein [Streptomyces sp. NRRL S-1022]